MKARQIGWWSVAPIAVPVTLGALLATITRSVLAGILFGGVVWIAEGVIVHMIRSVPIAK